MHIAIKYTKLPFLLILFFLICAIKVSAQSTAQDSLQTAIAKTQDPRLKIPLLFKLVDVYLGSDLDKALETAEQGSALANENKFTVMEGEFLQKKGQIQEMKSLYNESHGSLDQAIQLFRQSGEKQKEASAIERKGATYQRQGSFNEAVKTYMRALTLFEELQDKSGIGQTYAQISDALCFQNQFKEGVDYGKRAIQIFEEENDQEEIVMAYDATASNYIGLEDYPNAIKMMNEAVRIKRSSSPGSIGLAGIVNTRGNAYKNAGQLEKALLDYQESYKIAEQFQHLGGMSATSANTSDVYMRLGKYAEALPYQIKSVKLMEESGFYANSLENYKNLSFIYEELGDYKNAIKYLQKHNYARDSIVSVDQEAAVVELRTKYETEKKEATIAAQEEKLTQQKFIQWLGIGFIGLLGFSLFLAFRNVNLKKRSNDKLEKANALLQKKNAENELLLKEIHHRVKNNLQTISSLLNIQSESIDDVAAFDAIQESKNRVTSMSLIHQKLYLGENLASVEMRNYFETMGSAILEGFGSKADHIDLEVDMNEIELDVDAAIPVGLITNELITNSVKYAFPENKRGKIKISLEQLDNHEFKLVIADDGTPTQGQEKSKEGTGFGSLLIQLLTAQLGGKIDISTKEGTAAIIQFPMQVKSAV
jgi:two-component sensor histidine kinase